VDPEIQKIVDSLVDIGDKINEYREGDPLYCNRLITAVRYIDKVINQLDSALKEGC